MVKYDKIKDGLGIEESKEDISINMDKILEIRRNSEHTGKYERYYEHAWRIMSDAQKIEVDKERFEIEKEYRSEASKINGLFVNLRERELRYLRRVYEDDSRCGTSIRVRIKEYMLNNPQLDMIADYDVDFYTADNDISTKYEGITVSLSFISTYKIPDMISWFKGNKQLALQFINEIILNDRRANKKYVDLSRLRLDKVTPLPDSRLMVNLKFK